jgi:rubrerythrin
MSMFVCKSAQDVIQFAIDKEQREMEFYDKCSKRAKNPAISQFFRELSGEEEKHRDMLTGLRPVDLEGVKLEKVENLKISDYLVDIPYRDDLTYQEALILAMKKEEKAHDFYAEWKGKCGDDRTAKLFQMLEIEELKHKRKLEAVYDDEILNWD